MFLEIIGLSLVGLGVIVGGLAAISRTRRSHSRVKVIRPMPPDPRATDGQCYYCGRPATGLIGRIGPASRGGILCCDAHVAIAVAQATQR